MISGSSSLRHTTPHHRMGLTPGPSDALLIIDVQNDFLPGGALAVPDGDAILPVIRQLTHLPFGVIITSQDWHPAQHVSFKTATPAGPWPPHCVAGTQGAALAADLTLPADTLAVFKGAQTDQDSYSAFGGADAQDVSLAALLQRHGINRIFLCGLALDYCVQASALDARKAGLETVVLTDASRGIAHDLTPALTILRTAGVVLRTSQDLAPGIRA
ncbi:nicotinamidase [Acetobacter persici]|uniref:nicotinamidase n=1 Tax=Acetobacter persici TaxID=1076596 RepID=UPI001F2F91FD|nr:nicotinamidase [Acetobacter persici]MCG0997292.1 nicotinamidase [Acetobacter persici]